MEDEKKTAGETLGVVPLHITAQDVLNALFNADDTVCFRVFDDKKRGIFRASDRHGCDRDPGRHLQDDQRKPVADSDPCAVSRPDLIADADGEGIVHHPVCQRVFHPLQGDTRQPAVQGEQRECTGQIIREKDEK